ncbi:flotillin family protein [Pseudomonas aeruginosa]
MDISIAGLVLIGVAVAIVALAIMTLIKQYKICPNNQLMVVYGAGSAGENAKVLAGGGAFVIPFVQECAFMSLTPISITIPLEGALSSQSIRVSVPCQFTICIDSKTSEFMQNAVRSLLFLEEEQIKETAKDIIIGSLRQVVAGMTIEELARNRDEFQKSINKTVTADLNKIGMSLISVNVVSINDESNFIDNMGKKAAAEANSKALVEVAEQERVGAIGVEEQNREKTVSVAQQRTQTEIGVQEAERQRAVRIAALQSETTRGQNEAKADIAKSNAELVSREAEAFQTGEVAKAQAQAAVAQEQRIALQSEIERDTLPKALVAKEQVVIAAQAQAQQIEELANGEAAAMLAKFKAEADGLQLILEGKAKGYKAIIDACGGDTQAAANMLMIEQVREIVQIQAEAMSKIKIDKITVWDSGGGEGDAGFQGFMRRFAAGLPPVHELCKQAGIELPPFMGKILGDAEHAVSTAHNEKPLEGEVIPGTKKKDRLPA